MFTRIQVLGFKCLRYVDVALKPFGILIGPNASGKSTLLDVFAFLQDALLSDVESAVRKRGFDLRELTWMHKAAPGFEFALEALPPSTRRGDTQINGIDSDSQNAQRHLRYELAISLNERAEIAIAGEKLWLTQPTTGPALPAPNTLITDRAPRGRGWRIVLRRTSSGDNTYYHSENTDWNFTLRSPQRRLGLAVIPEDEERFSAALWLRETLSRSVQVLQLDSVRMRQPCPADAPRTFQPDGSNLPVMVHLLQERSGKQFESWLAHVRSVLPDLEAIEVAERPENRARYLRYRNGVVVPSWLISDGTLRLLALTLIAYLPLENQVFIVEEPENGVHPKALEAVFQSLSSVYESQVFVATHSPMLLELAQPTDLLIFSRAPDGATTVVRGEEHFAFRDRTSAHMIGQFFAAGVLE